MYLKFSKYEFIALEKLCSGPLPTGELAKQMGKKDSYISRLAKTLIAKGLIVKQDNKLQLSDASHAQSFKLLYQSRPNAKIENWLSGYGMAILILSSFKPEGLEMSRFWEEIICSKPTAYKAIYKLKNGAVLNTFDDKIKTIDRLTASFANEYADNIMRMTISSLGEIKIAVRARYHVIVRAKAETASALFSRTGLNRLLDFGLEAMLTSYSDYYFNLDGKTREIGAEEAFVHAMLLTAMESKQDQTVLALFMRKNRRKISMRRLLDIAKVYDIVDLASDIHSMRRAIDYMEKI